MSLETREAELVEGCGRLARDALRRKQQGDLAGAKAKLLERKRAMKRLEKLRNSMSLVDAQLDALQTTELDKELMQTLLASSAALKKAGVGKGVKEAEAVMTELDEQMRESGELTSVLSGQLQEESEFDLEEEFEALLREGELVDSHSSSKIKEISKEMGHENTSEAELEPAKPIVSPCVNAVKTINSVEESLNYTPSFAQPLTQPLAQSFTQPFAQPLQASHAFRFQRQSVHGF